MADRTFLDWPFFNDGHRKLAAELRAWCETNISDDDHDEHNIDAVSAGFVRKLGADGFLKYTVPASAGGAFAKLDVRSLALCRETLAYHHGLADFAFVMQGLGTGPISQFGTPEQQANYLPKVGRGERIAALAMSEENAGSDVAALTTTVREDGDHYVVNGAKTWISNAGIAHQYSLIARLGDAPGAKNLVALIVDADTPGVSVPHRIDVIAPHPLGTVKFDNARIPKANLLGKPGDGFKIAMSNLDVFRSTVGAAALGFARRALDEALKRSETRMVFGQKLGDFQLTQAKIADMATQIDASALLIYRAAWTKDMGAARVTREASMAKMYATEAAQQVVDAAVQLWGGMGVVSGNTVEKLYREVRALRIYEGTTEINKLVIAGQTLQAWKQGSAS